MPGGPAAIWQLRGNKHQVTDPDTRDDRTERWKKARIPDGLIKLSCPGMTSLDLFLHETSNYFICRYARCGI